MHGLLYVVEYTGTFGFIKPFSANRDELMFSQRFITSSILIGMRDKLGTSPIRRHKLYSPHQLDIEQVTTESKVVKKHIIRLIKDCDIKCTDPTNQSIVKLGKLVNPKLYLAFDKKYDAEKASQQSLNLCNKEYLIFPSDPYEMYESEFNNIPGVEFFETDDESDFSYGFSRYNFNTKTNRFSKIYGYTCETL